MKPAMILIDMQRHFRNENPVVFLNKLLPNLSTALSAARELKLPIIHVITQYSRDKSNLTGPELGSTLTPSGALKKQAALKFYLTLHHWMTRLWLSRPDTADSTTPIYIIFCRTSTLMFC